ncbi:uncharacterized protein LOC126744345 isoform X1 [Anthonomus grandis grandis]|uniref:uncharacterized protein LOC126744345 isoform X1 n=1 Tax=Anthonomus grandis grandis TaxID=2921223 RepID=UPI002166594E|nr:uncharacterized protein LOC126744345 isoform X1 [Anthonomus grandis grandis]
MAGKSAVLIFAFLIQGVISLQLEKLLIPSHAIRNTSVIMECHYKLEGETLYSVKWYKDGYEFYRFVPRNQPPAQVFPLPGVSVDLHNSTEYSVVLSSVQLSTSGLYRCEVSGEAPYFDTVTDHAYMTVVALPKSGPEITGGQLRYHVGDFVNVNCTTRESKPAAQLSWMINGEPADPRYIKGPYKQYVGREGLESTSLVLQFTAKAKHFKRGNMKLKCLATIATVYTTNNEKSFEGERAQKGIVLESRGTVAPSGSRADRVHTSGSMVEASAVSTSISKIIVISWLYLKIFV